jgi:hypothetical protein
LDEDAKQREPTEEQRQPKPGKAALESKVTKRFSAA